MTFNTTSLPLQRALARQLLLERLPLRPSGEQKRYLLVAPQIDAMLDGHLFSGLFPDISADTLIGIYCAGHNVTVSRKFTKQKPDLERIQGYNEVWALCPRKPPPGWRILGRFYEKNVFVALRAWEKNKLFAKYAQAAKDIIADWQELFHRSHVHRGTEVSDYLSGVFRDVDEEEK